MDLEGLIQENENIQEIKAKEKDVNKRLTSETEYLLKQVREVRAKHQQLQGKDM